VKDLKDYMNRSDKLFLFIIIIISMLFTSVEIFCDSEEKILLRSHNNVPEWVRNIPEDHYVGVSDKNSELEAGIEQAVSNSFLYVLMKLGVSVSSRFEVNTRVVGEDFVRDIIDELAVRGHAEFEKQHIKSTYYEKYRVYGKEFFRVSVLVYFSSSEIERIRERFSEEREVLKSDIEKFFIQNRDFERSVDVTDYISNMYSLWKRSDSLLMDEQSDRIIAVLSETALSIKVDLIGFEDGFIKLYAYMIKDNKKIILDNMFFEYSLTYGSGYVEKYGMTDKNGVSKIRADISAYIDSKAVIKASPVWNQIVSYEDTDNFKETLKKSENEVLVKKQNTLVVFADSSQNIISDELFSMFSGISDISVLKSDIKTDKAEDIFSSSSADFVIVSQKSRGKLLFSIFKKNGRGAQKAVFIENTEANTGKDKIFVEFLKIINPSKIFVENISIFPEEVKWYYMNKSYNLNNIKIYAYYSDGRREEVENVIWKLKNAEGRIENNTFFIDRNTGKHILECEYIEDGIVNKCEFILNMHWEKGVTVEDALDTDIKFEMPSKNKWEGITWDSSDGMDSIATGDFSQGESILLIRLKGPEEFKFAWKITGEEASDVMLFYINEKLRWAITGNTEWETRSISLPPGDNILKWVYKKTSGLGYIESNAKLDRFEYSGNGEGGTLIKIENIQNNSNFRDRSHSQMFSLNGKMFLIGGESARRVRADIWSSEDGLKWQLERTQGEFGPRKDFRTVVMNNIVYLSGGTDSRGNPMNDIWFSEDGIYWKNIRKNAEFEDRFSHEMISYNNRLYIAGGSDGKRYFNDVWISENGEKWELLTQSASFEPRKDFNMIHNEKGIFIINGKGQKKSFADTWYSVDGKIWKKSSQRSASQAFAAGSIIKTAIYFYMLGGVEENGMLSVYKNTIFRSTDLINWEMVTTTSSFEPRAWFSSVFHNGAIYLSGGQNMKNKYSDVWRIESSD
jgi:hypothetical protein